MVFPDAFMFGLLGAATLNNVLEEPDKLALKCSNMIVKSLQIKETLKNDEVALPKDLTL